MSLQGKASESFLASLLEGHGDGDFRGLLTRGERPGLLGDDPGSDADYLHSPSVDGCGDGPRLSGEYDSPCPGLRRRRRRTGSPQVLNRRSLALGTLHPREDALEVGAFREADGVVRRVSRLELDSERATGTLGALLHQFSERLRRHAA